MEPEPPRHVETDAEVQLLRAFVLPNKRERYIALATSKQRRGQFLSELHHFRHFDPRWIRKLRGEQDSPGGLIRELKRLGAVEKCYVISANREWDSVTGPLKPLIEQVFGRVEGTIVSCIPATLAYYEGEGPFTRFVLQRNRW